MTLKDLSVISIYQIQTSNEIIKAGSGDWTRCLILSFLSPMVA